MITEQTLRFLIVEDNTLSSQLIASQLEALGHRVAGQAFNGPQGIELVKQLSPDVVLMDLEMSDPETKQDDPRAGIKAAMAIQDECPTPVVILTAYGVPELIQEATQAGIGAYLLKPPDPEEIERAAMIAIARFGDMQTLRQLNRQIQREMTEREEAESSLRRIEWMLTKSVQPTGAQPHYHAPYDDPTEFNTCRVILDSVGESTLRQIAEDAIDLLDTSVAIYEKNGDYACGLFASSWCQFMDSASYRLCGDLNTEEALACGRWLCHENCWNESAKAAIESGEATDIECVGKIHLYAVPIFAEGDVIGVINVGYGTPPIDEATCAQLAEQFQVDPEDLQAQASAYESRPSYIIDIAKKRLHTAAQLIGEIVERKQAQEQLRRHADDLEDIVAEKMRELAEERAKAIQMDKLASLGEMATGIAHELRQPLTAIRFEADYLKMVETKVKDEHASEVQAVIDGLALGEIGKNLQEDVTRCQRLIDHLRDFGRVSDETPVPINLNDTIEDSLVVVGARLHNHGVDLQLNLVDDLPPVLANTHRLEQVFLNLISNAEYALACQTDKEPGHRKILEITTTITKDQVVAMVRDNGCGIPEDVQTRIFDPFFTTKPRGEGTGLGLSISYGIVADYGGEITCESAEDEGTTFTLRFPIAGGEEDQ